MKHPVERRRIGRSGPALHGLESVWCLLKHQTDSKLMVFRVIHASSDSA
ncbi:protein of unknown function [Azospirillum lipoferum 4B]|uniref:Uncharacterized protein n=1 Tax=Azospirillum lipoferum (strain 4B) TaxID=862719 RepID=G7Z7X4_AZOL4|nr:protein of unknown function [Azospirillum lipoferum 4B]